MVTNLLIQENSNQPPHQIKQMPPEALSPQPM